MLDSTPTSPKFVESAGGPLIVVGSVNLSDWEGVDAPSAGRIVKAEFRWNGPGTPATDYDRACDVKDEIGILALGSENETGDAIVFGGHPRLATVLQLDAMSLPLIVRIDYVESEDALVIALSAISNRMMLDCFWEDQGVQFAVTSNPLCLFDSAIPGSEAVSGGLDDSYITFHLPIGVYRIARYQFDFTDETRLDLYRFEQRQRIDRLNVPQTINPRPRANVELHR